MRSVALAAVLLIAGAQAAPPPEFLKAKDAASLGAASDVPPAFAPAYRFQMLFLRIRAGEPLDAWRADMAKFAADTTDHPLSAGLRNLALCWEARARMAEIDVALRGYYRDAVRFPETLAEVASAIPKAARTDPWGDEWTYAAAAPAGFSAKYAKQRYQLGPKRFPRFSSIAEAVARAPAPPAWKISRQTIGGAAAVAVTTPDGQRGVVQAGGGIGGVQILHIDDGWLLAADTERLFVMPF